MCVCVTFCLVGLFGDRHPPGVCVLCDILFGGFALELLEVRMERVDGNNLFLFFFVFCFFGGGEAT